MNVTRGYDDWLFAWDGESVVLRVSRVRQEKGGTLRAELHLQEITPDGVAYNVASPTSFILTSALGKSQAAKAMARAYGGMNWEDAIESVAMRVITDSRAGAPVIRAADVRGATQPPGYLVSPFLPAREATILYGDGGSGKSLMAQALATAVATGTRLPGCSAPEAAPVLYLDWEHHAPDAVARRFHWIAGGLGLSGTPENIHLMMMQAPIVDDLERVRQAVDSTRAGLVVMDSLGWAADDDINEARTAIRMMNAIRSLPATVLCVAHVSKADRRDLRSRRSIIGSGFFDFGSRSQFEVRVKRDHWGLVITLHHRKESEGALRTEPMAYKAVFSEREDYGRIVEFELTQTVSADDGGTSLEARIIAALARAKRPATAAEIAQAIHVDTPARVIRVLESLPNIVDFQRGRGRAFALAAKVREWEAQAAAAETANDEDLEVCGRCGERRVPNRYEPVDGGVIAICDSCAA